MTQPERSSALGPVVFVGLTIYTIVTAGPAPKSNNPSDTMSLYLAPRVDTDIAVIETQPPLNLPILQAVLRNPVPVHPDSATADTANLLPSLAPRIQIYLPDLEGAILDPAHTTPDQRDLALPAGIRGFAGALAPATLDTNHPDTAPEPLKRASAPQLESTLQALALVNPDLTMTVLPSNLSVVPRLAPLAMPQPAGPLHPVMAPTEGWLSVSADYVHIRSAPNARSVVYTQIDAGGRVQKIEVRGNWTRVFFADHDPPLTGWMYSAYLSPPVSPTE